jgi:hypothetical protein
MAVENSLAYYNTVIITSLKSFIVQATFIFILFTNIIVVIS